MKIALDQIILNFILNTKERKDYFSDDTLFFYSFVSILIIECNTELKLPINKFQFCHSLFKGDLNVIYEFLYEITKMSGVTCSFLLPLEHDY